MRLSHNETLSIQRDKAVAEEIAIECENFLSIPCVAHQTILDRILRRWRVSCLRIHLEDGFVWEKVP